MSDKDRHRELLFGFFIHEAENLHNSVDWFLIFHGILLEAFVSAHYQLHRVILGVLGSLVSYVWLVAGVRQLWNVKHLANAISDETVMGRETATAFAALFVARRKYQPKWMKWASAMPAFSAILPLAILIVWLALTATATECGVAWWPILVTAAVLFGATMLWRCVQERPRVPPEAIRAIAPRPDDSNPMSQENEDSQR
jgi:hypothetical protein